MRDTIVLTEDQLSGLLKQALRFGGAHTGMKHKNLVRMLLDEAREVEEQASAEALEKLKGMVDFKLECTEAWTFRDYTSRTDLDEEIDRCAACPELECSDCPDLDQGPRVEEKVLRVKIEADMPEWFKRLEEREENSYDEARRRKAVAEAKLAEMNLEQLAEKRLRIIFDRAKGREIAVVGESMDDINDFLDQHHIVLAAV